METVELATLLALPEKVGHLKNISPLWRGRVLTESGDYLPVWLKNISAQQVLSECVCALVGRAVDLPIPRPLLVLDVEGFLSESAKGALYFAMEDAEHPSVRQWIQDMDDPSVAQAILRWPKARECALFDEWVVNVDRNPGNLLYDGENSFVMIDHAHALGANQNPHIVPDYRLSLQNIIADYLIENSRDLEPQRLSRVADEVQNRWLQPIEQALKEHTCSDLYGMEQSVANISEFLHKRLPVLRELIDARSGRPKLELV